MPQNYSYSPYAQGRRQGQLVDKTLQKLLGSPPQSSSRNPIPSVRLPHVNTNPAVARLKGQNAGPHGLQPKTAGFPKGYSPVTGQKQPRQISRAALGEEARRLGQATPRQMSSLQREVGGFQGRNLKTTAQPMVRRGQQFSAAPANATEGMTNMELKLYGLPPSYARPRASSFLPKLSAPTVQHEPRGLMQNQAMPSRQSIGLGEPAINAPDSNRSPVARRSEADIEFGVAPKAQGPLHMQGAMGSPESRLHLEGTAPGLSKPKMNAFGEPVDFPVAGITDLRRPPMDATEQAMGSMDYATDPLTVQNSPVNARSKFPADGKHMLDDSGKLVKRGGGPNHSTRARGQRPGAEPKSAYEAYKAGTGLPDLEAHVEMMENTPLQISQEDRQRQAQMNRDGAAASDFLRPGGGLTKLYEGQAGGNNTMYDSSDPAQMLMPAPRSPGVDEDLQSRLRSRSDQSRSTMQPGGMGFTGPVEDDGYAFKGSGATPGVRFDAGMFRNRQDQISFLDDKVARHMAQADESGVVTTPSGATRTIDSDPSSPAYGKISVTGAKQAPRTSAQKLESAARRSARATGSVYTDDDGKITDYGQLNKNRDAFRERQAERKEQARELRMRRAQLRNYGSTGGRTFGPNMSLNQATRMAQGQLDQENRFRDAQERQDEMIADQQRRQDVSTYIETAQQDPALARQFANQAGLEGFQGKTTAETAQEMENRSAMRANLSEDPQSILDIEADIMAQHPNDPAAQEEMRSRLGITPDMLQSAMRRTQPGLLGSVYDTGRRAVGYGIAGLGEGIDDALGTNIFGGIGAGIGNYFAGPSDDEIDQQEQRRRVNRRMNQQGMR